MKMKNEDIKIIIVGNNESDYWERCFFKLNIHLIEKHDYLYPGLFREQYNLLKIDELHDITFFQYQKINNLVNIINQNKFNILVVFDTENNDFQELQDILVVLENDEYVSAVIRTNAVYLSNTLFEQVLKLYSENALFSLLQLKEELEKIRNDVY